MRLIKLYEEFLEEKKFTLATNESLFDKIESLVKGKSAKGEIISKLLQTNAIKETGSVFGLWYLGGAEPGKDSMSNPLDYLHYTPGIAKVEDGKIVLIDEKAKKLKVHDTIPFMINMEGKDQVAKNFTFGLKPGSSVWKADYMFNLSSDTPTLTMKAKTMCSIPSQKWVDLEGAEKGDQVIELGEDAQELDETAIFSFKTPLKEVTLEEWVTTLNETGWVEKDEKYFTDTMKIGK